MSLTPADRPADANITAQKPAVPTGGYTSPEDDFIDGAIADLTTGRLHKLSGLGNQMATVADTLYGMTPGGGLQEALTGETASGVPLSNGQRALSAVGAGLTPLAALGKAGKGAEDASVAFTKYGAHMEGALPASIANTFRGGSYKQRVLSEDMILYRVYGGSATETGTGLGGYFTTVRPQGALQARMDLAILPEWGNTATEVAIFRIPKGTTIYEGFVAPQGNLFGGGTQVYIPVVPPSWVVK